MATSYTTLLGLALPVTGELSGTWGDTVNNYISNYIDAAVAGAQTVTTNTTLTKTTGSSLDATSSQYAIIIASPASANITITAPAASKIYTIINTSGTYTVTIRGAGPTTGVTLGVNEKAQVAWNGSDFIKISNTGGAASFTNVTVTGTTTLSGLTASTALALDASKNVVSVTNTGTGNNVLSASPTLTGTVAGASLSLSSLTSGRVTYAGTSGLLQDSANLLYSGTDLTVYGITVGRGAGAVATNTAVGASALAGSNSGVGYNTGIGASTLFTNSTGVGNTALGHSAMYANTTGSSNVAIGAYDGSNEPALRFNTTGGSQVAVGVAALKSNTTGSNNVGVGFAALQANTTASNNTAVGYQAGYNNTTGTSNVYIGFTSGYYQQTNGSNTAVGFQAFQGNSTPANNTGVSNSAFGRNALLVNSSGTANTAIGQETLQANTTASNNTAAGYQAGYSNTTGGVTAFGFFAGRGNTTGTSNISFGDYALYTNTTGAANTAIGSGALLANTTASFNTAVGYQAGYNNQTAIGAVFIGYQAGYSSVGISTTINYNTAVGNQAGYALTSGYNNTFLGNGSGNLVTTGYKNTILGAYSGNQGGLDIRTANNYIVLSDGDGNPRVYHDGTFLFTQQMALGSTQNINYGNGLSFGAAGKGLLLQQTVNTDDERVYLTNNAQTSTTSGFTGAFAYNKTGAGASTYYQVAGQHLWLSAGTGTAGDTISWTNILSAKKDTTVALQGASLQSGTGVTFPATQNASSNANTLDDFEEGTWTPTIVTSNGNQSITYNTQTGRYVKIGRLVKLSWYINTATVVSQGTGTLLINGAPGFAPDTNEESPGSFWSTAALVGGTLVNYQVGCRMNSGSEVLLLNNQTSALLATGSLNGNAYAIGQIVYIATT